MSRHVRHVRPARPVLAAAAVVIDDGRVLLIRRGQAPDAGAWSIPGGAVELAESVEDALRREVREETGLEIAIGDFLEVFERVEHDAEDAVFADLADLDRYDVAESVRRVIARALP